MFRIGRSPDPWDLPDWKFGPFRGRFDDPEQRYRVRYAALSPHGAFVEKLAIYRPDVATLIAAAKIAGPEPQPRIPRVPASFFTEYAIGKARANVPGDNGIVDFSTAQGMIAAFAVIEAAARVVGHPITGYDASTLLKNDRAFTQAISSTVYESGFAGIAYCSRYEPSEVCVALFEGRHTLFDFAQSSFDGDDVYFGAACAAHGITLEGGVVSTPP